MEIKLDARFTNDFISKSEIDQQLLNAEQIKDSIINKTGKGNDFLGWVDLPNSISNEEISNIEKTAKHLKKISNVVVIVGIGGSYLGSRAVIEALKSNFRDTEPKIVFAGHQLDETYHFELLKYLDNKDYSIVVISKSGTTTEPAIAFRLLKKHIEAKYGFEKSKERIVAITDQSKGALKKLATQNNYKTYVIPDDVGGRYSVLTPVGLLPISIAGFDIKEIINGAITVENYFKTNIADSENSIFQYAAIRNLLYKKSKTTEILVSYSPKLSFIIEWWKQLFGESEGKENKGIFPTGVNFTSDLHSLGQYIQDGLRNLFETVIEIENSDNNIIMKDDPENLDGLNYLSGKSMHYVNQKAMEGTILAHIDGGVPNLKLLIPTINENILGQLIYFFEISCAVSGYMLEVNPFDQPGVEAYKKNMFRLLGKE